MELLDGEKLKKIRNSSNLDNQEVLNRSGVDNIQYFLDLEAGSREITFKTLLLLAHTFQRPIKDFMPDSTVNVIYSQSNEKLIKARRRYQERISEYPLIGSMENLDVKTVQQIESGSFTLSPEDNTIKYASIQDSSTYAVIVENDSSAPEFLINSMVIVSPGTRVKDGDYCLVIDLASNKRYIRNILIREGYYILQPDDNGGSLILSDNRLIVHKIIGSVGVSK